MPPLWDMRHCSVQGNTPLLGHGTLGFQGISAQHIRPSNCQEILIPTLIPVETLGSGFPPLRCDNPRGHTWYFPHFCWGVNPALFFRTFCAGFRTFFCTFCMDFRTFPRFILVWNCFFLRSPLFLHDPHLVSGRKCGLSHFCAEFRTFATFKRSAEFPSFPPLR